MIGFLIWLLSLDLNDCMSSWDDFYAVGDGTILHYDGSTWVPQSCSNCTIEDMTLYGIHGTSTNDVWSVGDGVILHKGFGDAWQLRSGGVGYTLRDVFAFDLNGELKWKKSYGREWTKSYPGVRCTPTVDQDSMYDVSGLGELVSMNAETGSVTWRVNVLEKFGGGTGRFGFIESLLINGRQLICTAGAKDAALVAFNKDTGKIIWKTAGLNDKAAYCSH